MKRSLILFLALVVCLSAFATVSPAQMSSPQSTTVKIGLLNARAKNIVVPKGAKLADEKALFMAVTVELLVDETGKVTDAKAIDGDSRHWEAAVKAARASTFIPYAMNGRVVKMSGKVIYEWDPMADYSIDGDFLTSLADGKIAEARSAMAKKDYVTAIAKLTDAIMANLSSSEAYFLRGNAYAATNRKQLAADDYRVALKLKPGNDEYKRALEALERPVVTPPQVAKRADIRFAELLKSYGEILDKKYEPKDAEYNAAKKQALAQKASIASGNTRGPLDTSRVCRILGELKTINASMFDYYETLEEMYSDGDVNGYPDLKIKFQEYQELQEMIDADGDNEPALWKCPTNVVTAVNTPVQQLNADYADAVREIDDLIAKFDKAIAGLTSGLAKSDANVGLQRTLNCSYYNQTKDVLGKIQSRLERMNRNGLPVYERGRTEYNKRVEQRKQLPVLQNCTLYV